MANYDIAIVGMGCVFPEANNIEEYWKNILSGDQLVTEMKDDLWPMEQFYSKERKGHKTYTKAGSFLKEFNFNALDYKLPPKNFEGVDKAQLVAIEATRQALEDAGIKPRSKELEDAVTIIGGSGVDEYAHVSLYLNRYKFYKEIKPYLQKEGLSDKEIDDLFEEFSKSIEKRGHKWHPSVSAIGAVMSSVSNRVAQIFGIKGYNMVVDGACASSFVSLSVACHALMAGDAKTVIAGGIDLGVNPAIYIGFARLGGLSENGNSNPFDNTANGLVIGEGGGIVILKRLEDAVADGNKIHSVIRGIGTSSDGAGQAIYNPSVQQRSIAMQNALDTANIDSKQIQFLEAHATSTIVGDANEYDAISTVYHKRDLSDPLYIGTVKHQIGHLKAAAGVAGLIKTVLAMKNGKIPHMPRFRELTKLAQKKVDTIVIPSKLQEWKPRENGSKYAAITASGFGGVNFHVIIEEAPSYSSSARIKVNKEMAIVGVVNRLPGADTVDKFWENTIAGKDIFQDIDIKKLGWEENYKKDIGSEKIVTPKIALIDDFEINYLRHKISPRSVSQTSPTQILSVELADRLLTGYGLELKEKKNIGVSLGAIHDDNYATISYPLNADEYAEAFRQTNIYKKIDKENLETILQTVVDKIIEKGPPHTEATLPGWMSNVSAGIVANRLNCLGPNFTVDTACSSGLAAMLPAMYQLMFTDIDMMIAGGLNRHTTNVFISAVTALGAISEDKAAPFDESGKGFFVGEGGVMYLLKRPEDAERDGDEIIAVLNNVGGSSEWASKTMVAPSEDALKHAIHTGLKGTNIKPEQVGVVDTHGSANKVSDIVEARAIASELRPSNTVSPVHITAIKSHIGHAFGGSGVAGMLSVIQTLKTGIVPGIRNLNKYRPEIEDVLNKAKPQKGKVKLSEEFSAGGVTSLGLGGANYFALLSLYNGNEDDKKVEVIEESTENNISDSENILIIRAKDNNELENEIKKYLKTTKHEMSVTNQNICLTVSYSDKSTLEQKLKTVLGFLKSNSSLKPLELQGIYYNNSFSNNNKNKLAFCFPGQGTHYIGMGSKLYAENNTFKEIIDEVHELSMQRYNLNLKSCIYSSPEDTAALEKLSTIEGAQISLFAIEVGVARVLNEMGVRPDVSVGHSFGEIAALTFGGVWDIKTGFDVVAARIDATKLVGESDIKLKMMSVICTDDQKNALLNLSGGKLVLSNINAPGQYVISGFESDVKKIASVAETLGIENKILLIDSAFHSKFMQKAVAPFRDAIAKLPVSTLQIPVLSTISGEYVKFSNSEELADLLSKQLVTQLNMPREINRLYNEGVRYFLEVGPRWSLSKMIEVTLKDKEFSAVPTLHPKIGDEEMFRRALAFLSSIDRFKVNQNDKIDLKANTGTLNMYQEFFTYLKDQEPSILSLLEEAHSRFAGKEKTASSGAKESIFKKQYKEIEEVEYTENIIKEEPIENEPSIINVSSGDDISVWIERARKSLALSTGYPEDMLGKDLDLEADLGIDSVQRAEIWGALVKEFNLDSEARPGKIKTLTELATELSKISSPTQSITKQDSNDPVTEIKENDIEPSRVDISVWIERARKNLAESTGYPEDMLGEDLDLEADLGIDSVQRAEIWGALIKEFNLDSEARPDKIKTLTELATELSKISSNNQSAVQESELKVEDTPKQSVTELTGDVSVWIDRARKSLAKSTGYPEDMLGEDLDLEADLGIDSVQRAEIWGTLVKEYNLDQEARPEKIKTLTELGTELLKISPQTDNIPITETKKEESKSSEIILSENGGDVSVWIDRARKSLAASTGYPEDMLGSDLDLEADLGIDSVQRAEIWGALVKEHNLDAEARPGQIKTLTELASELLKISAVIEKSIIQESKAEVRQSEKVSNDGIGVWVDRARKSLADSTGYPEDMLGSDLDLEADLGIDSVQQAEIWGALVKEHNLDAEVVPGKIKTLTELATELLKISSNGHSKQQNNTLEDSKKKNSNAELGRLNVKIPDNPDVCRLLFSDYKIIDRQSIESFNCEKILAIVDTEDNARFWETLLKKAGKESNIYTIKNFVEFKNEEIQKKVSAVDTIILLSHENLHKSNATGNELNELLLDETHKLYEVFRKLSSSIKSDNIRIICPVNMDGAFGAGDESFKQQGSFPAGFIRSLHHELPNCKFQLIDTGSHSWEDVILRSIDNLYPKLETGFVKNKLVSPVLVKISSAFEITNPLKKNDLVFVTGGARGIVYKCVLELAKITGCKLLLTGRTELPTGDHDWLNVKGKDLDKMLKELEISMVREKKMNLGDAKRMTSKYRTQNELHNNLLELKESGIECIYEVCDVQDKDIFGNLIKKVSEKEQIKGIVHGAGVQKSKLFDELTDSAIDLTLKTKLNPLYIMSENIDFSELKLLSAFGSIAGLFGNSGQSDYALANDLLACAVSSIGKQYNIFAQTIEWTAWTGTGMVTDAEAERFKESGLVTLDVELGINLFLQGIFRSSLDRMATFNEGAQFAQGRELLKTFIGSKPLRRLTDKDEKTANFSLDSDIYIEQHLVQYNPVVPGTFTTEIFLETLSEKGKVLENIKFKRPLWVRDGELKVEIIQANNKMMIVPKERPDISGKALETLSYSICNIVDKKEIDESEILNFTQDIYNALNERADNNDAPFYTKLDTEFDHILKSGPVFRGVRATIEENGIYYSLIHLTNDAVKMFEVTGEFIINPVAADMAIQTGAAWGIERMNVMAIPFEIGTLRVYNPTSCRDAVVICKAHEMTDTGAKLDMLVREPDGKLIFTMDNVILKTIAGKDEK